MADKTNAMRLLDARKVSYTARTYDERQEFHSAEEAAAMLGAPPNSVFKTLVVLREPVGRGKRLLVMLPAHAQLDLRLLAQQIGEKKLRMATQKEAESLTGLQVGGISALALIQRGFQVYLDASARSLERIHISAGVRGVDLELSVADLVALTAARYVQAVQGQEDK